MTEYWREDDLTLGYKRVENDCLHIREGNPDAYNGSVHHSLMLEFVPATDDNLASVRLRMSEGVLAGFGANERHDVELYLSDFVNAIRDLARKHDTKWQASEKRRREKWAETAAAKALEEENAKAP